jgi:hypothetical protein
MDLEFHQAAEIFPLMTGPELEALVADIHEHGQREHIVLLDGKILDGRNRYRACQEIVIDPVTVNWCGEGSRQAYAVSMNLHRPHLNESQRAIVAARLATLKRGYPGAQRHDGPIGAASGKEAAEHLNVSRKSVVRAKLILKEGSSQEIAEVVQGNAAVSTVARQFCARASKKSPTPKAKAGPQEEPGKHLMTDLDLPGQCTKGELVELAITDDERTQYVNARFQDPVIWLQGLAHASESENIRRSVHIESTRPVIGGTLVNE